MFSLFRSKKVEPAPVFQTADIPVPGLIVPGMVFLRAKKWVTVKGRVGIVVSADTSGYVKVHLTNEKGETVEQIRVPVGDVRLTASHQLTPSGGVAFSGTAPAIKEKVVEATGGVNFGGSARLIFVPVGGTGTNDSDRISVGVSRKVGVS